MRIKETLGLLLGSENAKQTRSALDDGLFTKWTVSIRLRGELSIARERARAMRVHARVNECYV